MKKIISISLILTISIVGYSQCSEIISPNNINKVSDIGICGAEVNYISPYIIDTCATYFFEDFENGAPGWSIGDYGTVKNWVIQGFSGTGKVLGSNMFGVPHSGNYAFGGTEHSFIQSPSFSSAGGGIISFDCFVNNEPAFHDKELIQISFDGGLNWNQLVGDQLPNDENNIQSLSFNISSNEGAINTVVRFIYNTVDACCGAQDGFFIDNVRFEKEVIVQQVAGLGNGSIFPIGNTTEVYEIAHDGIIEIISFDVSIISVNDIYQTLFICDGETITVGNNSYSETGSYVDSLVTQYGCDSIVTTNLTVKLPIDISLTVTNNLMISNEFNATYQWVDCSNSNSIITGENNRDFVTNVNGSYAVIINKNGCEKISSSANVFITDVKEITQIEKIDLSIYPNPILNKFHIQMNENISEAKISIIDVRGAEVYRNSEFKSINNMIDLSSYSSGIYFLRVESKEKFETIKIVKK